MPTTGDGAMFVGVDRAVFAAAFAERLRRSRVPVAFSATLRFVRALDAVSAPDVGDLYWMARLSFVDDVRSLDRFDAVFAAVFDTEAGRLPGERRGDQPSPLHGRDDDVLTALRRSSDDGPQSAAALPWATLPSATLDGDDRHDDHHDDESDDAAIPELRPSIAPTSMDRPFAVLDEAELARVGDVIESAAVDWPSRRSRRHTVGSRGGRIAMRRSMQRAMRTGGDVVDLVTTTRRRVPRRVVAIVDVSGSMESYARAYLHLARPLVLRRDAEVFAFATSLTRITGALRRRSPREAIDELGDTVGDRFSGTRLASSLSELLRHRTWSTLVRGSVVVVFSDGWDGDDPADLDRQMTRLALRAHRVVWVNPRAAAHGFEPLAGGMAAALPHCDAFLAGDTARSLERVVGALSDG